MFGTSTVKRFLKSLTAWSVERRLKCRLVQPKTEAARRRGNCSSTGSMLACPGFHTDSSPAQRDLEEGPALGNSGRTTLFRRTRTGPGRLRRVEPWPRNSLSHAKCHSHAGSTIRFTIASISPVRNVDDRVVAAGDGRPPVMRCGARSKARSGTFSPGRRCATSASQTSANALRSLAALTAERRQPASVLTIARRTAAGAWTGRPLLNAEWLHARLLPAGRGRGRAEMR